MAGASPHGTYHVSNGGPPVSWAGFTREIFARAGFANTVTDTTTEAYLAGTSGAAVRPADSTFDLAKIRGTGFEPRDWREDLADFLAREAAAPGRP
jgi:dTDP-4-dehydrorhamnose 3,5-epimerase